jgi:predicted transcriptional regulator
VKRSNGERGYVWSARVSRARTATELVRKVLDHVFDGLAYRLVSHRLDEKGLDSAERDETRQLLELYDERKIKLDEEGKR